MCFFSAIERLQGKITYDESGKCSYTYVRRGKVGRKPLISDEDIAIVGDDITTQCKQLKSPKLGEFNKMVVAQIASKAPNNYVADTNIMISERTMRRYKQKANVSKIKADLKNALREEGFTNIRNPLSTCAMMKVVLDSCPSESIYSTDDTSVLVNGWHRPYVLTTPQALAWSRGENIGVSSVGTQQQQRVVVFNGTISQNDLACCIVKVKDNNFNYTKQPQVYSMDDDFYVMLYHPSCPELEVTKRQMKIIIRVIDRRRTEAIERDLLGLQSVIFTPSDGDGSDPTAVAASLLQLAGTTSSYTCKIYDINVRYMIYI